MWKKIMTLVLLLVIATIGAIWAKEEQPDKTNPDQEIVVKGNNEFALDIYAKLREQEGNLFFSPWSISTALAMTYAGARGETATQMAKVLHFGLDQEQLHPAFAELISDLNAEDKKRGYQLHIANALWGQQGYSFLKSFLGLTRKNYDAGLREVDFAGATEKACKTINDWVAKQTLNKIKDLIKQGVLNPLTRLVLTNAIYFKGDWASKFNKKWTEDIPFTLITGKKVNVPIMNQDEDFRYMKGGGFQVLELPYVGDELSMVVLLPEKADGLTDFEKSFTMDNLTQWLPKLREQEVIVYLPKFKMTCAFSLGDVLKSMGMADAFIYRKADFSGIDGTKKLFISAVIHKAFVEVNEEGTEAAAATGIETTPSENGGRVPEFRADHPFIFLIRDTRSNSILFLGRVINPKEE